jgi:23S rRNA (guanine745-N1)-methyltransferase
MHTQVIQELLCPICRDDLTAASIGLACPSGHGFDLARQGYVNLIQNQHSVRIR